MAMTEKADTSAETPMLRQYREVKACHQDAILFYRIGDFYEMFYDDAITASKALDIVLTSRNKNDPNPVPLCGVPYHSVQPYLQKLIEKGFKVAICDQVEDPKTAKGVVKREVTRVVTPGLAGPLEGIDEPKAAEGRTLAAVHRSENVWGIAVLDIATGDFRVTEVTGDLRSLQDEIGRLDPKEILVREGAPEFGEWDVTDGACLSRLPAWVWEEAFARRLLQDQFGVATLSGFNCENIPAAVIAAGAALHYVKETQKVGQLSHVTSLRRYERSEAMILNEESRRNLTLDEVIVLMDQTQTAMGRRRLREWFHAPLLKKAEIEKRLDAVEEILRRPALHDVLKKTLQGIYDLERINSRLSLGTAHARDLKGLAETLQHLKQLKPFLGEFQTAEFHDIAGGWNFFPDLLQAIEATLVEEPPLAVREGGLIRDGVRVELDELRSLRGNAKAAIAAMEDRERKRTGIPSLKVHYNRVFGYYLEVTTAHLAKVPVDFIRKQTLTNAERFITPELKEFEDKILGAEEKIRAIEYEIFSDLRRKALAEVPALQAQAGFVGRLDALLSLGAYARENKTIRPVIEDSGVLTIKQGRHPLVEKNIPAGSYVPNDLFMDVAGSRFLMITGPNMAGKSTVIRQAGVIVLMAQVGSFVPAEEAHIGIVDQIFTRVGASDRLARGESTFMVEMCETANILHHATERSLVLLDEIGRGTSTFDGISIAWAVAEYLHDKIKARTLFATHYHELIDLALTRPGIKNYNVSVKEDGGDIVFMYRLVPGGMSHSYGIHVAKLAGLPAEVIERSKEVLKNLEQGELEPEGAPRIAKKRKKEEGQGSLF